MLSTNLILFALLALASLSTAGTVSYNWDVTLVTANPDGRGARPVIGINGQWPCPKIEATTGDTVVINLNNKLGNRTTGLHFHGISQVGTNYMDGPVGATQCPIPPGSSMKYQFLVDNPGTYWYHSHDMGQYPDGLRGPLVVHDPNDPYKGKYDEEVVMSVSDWYKSASLDLVRSMEVPTNTQFRPPIPNSIIVNEGAGGRVDFVKGKTYRIRLINFAALGSVMVHFDSHTMQVIMNDGSYIKPTNAYQLRISPAQRYDFLITAIERDNYNFPFLMSLDVNRDYSTQTGLVWPANYTGYLMLDSSKPTDRVDVVSRWSPVNDAHFEALDGQAPFGPVTKNIQLDFDYCFDANNLPRACLNGNEYVMQKVPTLYSAVTTGLSNTNPAVYGKVNPFIVNFGDVVQIVLNNRDVAIHPFHLHGHQFQVLDRPSSGTGDWPGRDVNYAARPPQRDTVNVMGKSHLVIRYVADNPGVYLFHCHIEWHVTMGLSATIIEAPDRLRGLQIPADHINNCQIQQIPTSGNAGGNTQDLTDTSNYNTVNPANYTGDLYLPALKKRSRVVRRNI